MMNYLPIIINGLLTSWTCFYALSRLLKEKLDYKYYKTWVVLIINSLTLIILYLITDNVIRIIIHYIILNLLAKILFKKNVINLFFTTFFVLFLFFVAEIFYLSFVIGVFNISIDEFKTNHFNTMLTNTVISLTVYFFANIRHIKNFFSESEFLTNLNIKKNTVTIFVLSILTISIFLYYIYFEVTLILGIFFVLILAGMYLLLIIGFFKERHQNIKLQVKYEVLINNLNEYERMLDMQRVNNHENKNHLITIRGMLSDNNDKVKEYISNLLETKLTDDEELLYKTKKLPIGGLQGLIYQKLLLMKEKNINVNLGVSNHLNKIFFEKISSETNYHLCTTVGVILDNAIEAVESLKSKNIGISVYNEKDHLIITISNNFEGSIDLNKIDERGYSTKGKGRGYGLYLVKQILDRNNDFKLEREIIGNVFKQKLKIKI